MMHIHVRRIVHKLLQRDDSTAYFFHPFTADRPKITCVILFLETYSAVTAGTLLPFSRTTRAPTFSAN